MSYLDQLKKSFKVPAGKPKETKELPKPYCLGFLGSPLGVFEKIEAGEPANDPTRTAWRWLLNFGERNPLEVAFSPAATHAEVLASYPDALAAEPFVVDIEEGAAPITCEKEAAVFRWLAEISETDHAIITDVLTRCRHDSEALAYYLGRARCAVGDDLDDRRSVRNAKTFGRACAASPSPVAQYLRPEVTRTSSVARGVDPALEALGEVNRAKVLRG